MPNAAKVKGSRLLLRLAGRWLPSAVRGSREARRPRPGRVRHWPKGSAVRCRLVLRLVGVWVLGAGKAKRSRLVL